MKNQNYYIQLKNTNRSFSVQSIDKAAVCFQVRNVLKVIVGVRWSKLQLFVKLTFCVWFLVLDAPHFLVLSSLRCKLVLNVAEEMCFVKFSMCLHFLKIISSLLWFWAYLEEFCGSGVKTAGFAFARSQNRNSIFRWLIILCGISI